ncbi:Histone-lysine N-methyltransferase SETMAR [Eumeta japonica]|uniref:Histone-lysine N-methyltransferase SETMAR n=1 Tax=Eumeta variegata TaxID=151549 RepID=A0A4C1WED2_EUMVA|nr:Histone-lysine N-methyltransferase SETMAR [Eumeta japonica]
MADELKIDHKTVLINLKKDRNIKKLDTWISYEFTEKNLRNRILICNSLLKHNEIERFWKRLMKNELPTTRMVKRLASFTDYNETRNKMMQFLWWDWKDIMSFYRRENHQFEFVLVTADKTQARSWEYRLELIYGKGVVFHHHNARRHIFVHSANIERDWLASINASTT